MGGHNNLWRVYAQKYKNLCVAWLLLAVTVASFNGAKVSAQASTSGTKADLNYTATEELNSLSLMARDAVSTAVKEGNQLTAEARLYAETNIVNELGGRLLMIGEKVTISRTLLDKYVASGKTLSAADTDAWKAYLPQVSFDQATPAATVAQSTEPKKEEPKVEVAPTDNKTESSTTSEEKKSSGTPWYWWVLGIATLGGLYYILGGKPSKE